MDSESGAGPKDDPRAASSAAPSSNDRSEVGFDDPRSLVAKTRRELGVEAKVVVVVFTGVCEDLRDTLVKVDHNTCPIDWRSRWMRSADSVSLLIVRAPRDGASRLREACR